MTKPTKLLGTTYIATSTLFFATYGIWSRLMAETFGDFNQAWIRGLILLAILIPFGLFTKGFRRIRRQDWIWFAATAIPGGLNQAPYFYGFKHLPVGTATLLFYITLTLGAYIIGKLFFNENITPIKYSALVLATIGLGIIYKFSLTPDQLFPAIATSLAGLMGAAVVVFSKKLSSLYSKTQILTADFSVMFIANLFISLLLGEQLPSTTHFTPWLAQIGYAIAMLIANITVIIGFKHLEPSIGGLIGLLEVVFAAILGVIIFGEILTPSLVIGSTIIIFSAALPDLSTLITKPSFKTQLLCTNRSNF